MKKGFEELKNLDSEVVVSKAHIVQTTFEDIVNKRFDRLNPVKAKGLIKILEREFDLDLSEWTREFEAYHSIKEPEVPTIDKLNAEAAKNDKKPSSKIALIALVAAMTIGGGYMLYKQGSSASPETNGSAGLQSEINETNASISFNVAFDQNGTDQNGTDKNVTDKNTTAAPIAEKNTTSAHQNAPLGAQGTFFVEPTKKVWIGIRYLDTATNRWFETVAEKKFDFNGSREQLVAFGHAQVKIVAGGTVIESKAGGKVRYHYKNGKLREISEEEYNKLSGKTDAKKEANTTKPKQ